MAKNVQKHLFSWTYIFKKTLIFPVRCHIGEFVNPFACTDLTDGRTTLWQALSYRSDKNIKTFQNTAISIILSFSHSLDFLLGLKGFLIELSGVPQFSYIFSDRLVVF